MNESNIKINPLTFQGLWTLTLCFTILRAAGVIEWSLFWVLSPVIIPLLIVAGMVVLPLIAAIVMVLAAGILWVILRVIEVIKGLRK